MRIDDLHKMASEDLATLPCTTRRELLKLGLAVTGIYLGGTVLSLVSARRASAAGLVPEPGKYPYKPHYSMVLREKLCIDCELCKEACVKTNNVHSDGYRTTILEKRRPLADGKYETTFMPVLCNHCNNPPCVRVCPTTATWKDEKTGIVGIFKPSFCIGCKTCMTACPYNARYFDEERRAIDKCDFCLESRLSKGENQPKRPVI
jgi:Fe-S-cluster-containing dehydrogenase component